jgi:hypothetical protein
LKLKPAAPDFHDRGATLKSGLSIPGQTADALPITSSQPDKEKIREWLKSRRDRPEPLPNIEQIRRELGWKLP